MAVDFPHVDFVSIDVAPMTAHTPRANVIYEIYNVRNGIEEPADSFDFIYARHTMTAVSFFLESMPPPLSYIHHGSKFSIHV